MAHCCLSFASSASHLRSLSFCAARCLRSCAIASSDSALSLTGARLDDLQLLRYDTEVDSGEAVTVLSPEGFDGYQFAASGWLGDAPVVSDCTGVVIAMDDPMEASSVRNVWAMH